MTSCSTSELGPRFFLSAGMSCIRVSWLPFLDGRRRTHNLRHAIKSKYRRPLPADRKNICVVAERSQSGCIEIRYRDRGTKKARLSYGLRTGDVIWGRADEAKFSICSRVEQRSVRCS